MDIDEWEFLSDDTFHDLNEDGEKQTFLGKKSLESKGVLDIDYFCPSPSSTKISEQPKNPRVVHNHLVPLPILSEPKIPMEVTVVSPSSNTEKIKACETVAVEADQETASQVFFKIKENNEFVDMKMDSPKSSSKGLLLPQMDKGEGMENITSSRMKIGKEMLSMECDEEVDSSWEEEKTSGFNIWKWSFTGVGAICSFGVAAATVCVLFFGSRQRNKLQQDQKIRFQIYADDKRIKQVLKHASKLNDAVSALRGVPMSSAHITIGGYYDGL